MIFDHDVFSLTFLEEIEASRWVATLTWWNGAGARLSLVTLMDQRTVNRPLLRITISVRMRGNGRCNHVSLISSFRNSGQAWGLRFNNFLTVRKCGCWVLSDDLLLLLFRICPQLFGKSRWRFIRLMVVIDLSLHIFNLAQEFLLVQIWNPLFYTIMRIRRTRFSEIGRLIIVLNLDRIM